MDARAITELTQIDDDLRRGALGEAERRALGLRRRWPADARVAYQLGCVRLAQGRAPEAAEALREAFARKPDWVHPVVALANAARALGDLRETLRYCETAARMAPRQPLTWYNLACVLRDLRRHGDAVAAVDEMLRLEPGSLPGRILRMESLHESRRLEEAEAAARDVLARDPKAILALELLPRLCRARGALDEAADADARLIAGVAGGGAISPLSASYCTDDPAVLATIARASIAQRISLPPPPRAGERARLTIAYLSPDFRAHPVAQMLIPVLAAHDRTRIRVVTASLLADDDSDEGRAIRRLSDAHLALADLGTGAAVEALRGQAVDVLVDLVGCTLHARPALLHQRCAPVQVMWMGCAVSTGARWYDAWILDPVVAPAGFEAHASEPLLRLERCFHPITLAGAGADRTLTRHQVGLPEGVPVAAAFHRTEKITAEMFDAWTGIVASHPRAVLWLALAAGPAREALRARAAARGLDPARVVFADREPERARYLARWRLADLVLDSFPYGGHSTIAEALALGCPVVTRIGRSVPSRVAASMLHEHGLDDHVAADLDHYERLGRTLLGDASALAAAKQRFAAAAARIAGDANRGLTRSLEDACLALHRTALARA